MNTKFKWTTVLTLKCDGAARLMSRGQDASLTGAERAALRMHLLVCGACRQYRKQLAAIGGFFRLLASGGGEFEFKLSADRREAIQKIIETNTESL